jgi:hypothetical protein
LQDQARLLGLCAGRVLGFVGERITVLSAIAVLGHRSLSTQQMARRWMNSAWYVAPPCSQPSVGSTVLRQLPAMPSPKSNSHHLFTGVLQQLAVTAMYSSASSGFWRDEQSCIPASTSATSLFGCSLCGRPSRFCHQFLFLVVPFASEWRLREAACTFSFAAEMLCRIVIANCVRWATWHCFNTRCACRVQTILW